MEAKFHWIKMNNFQTHYNVFILHVLTARSGSHEWLKNEQSCDVFADFYESEHKWYVCVYSAKNKNEIKSFLSSKVQ